MAGIKSRLSLLPSVLLCRDSPNPRSLDPHSYMASPLRCSFHRALLIFFFFLRFPALQSRHPLYLR